MKNYIVLAIGLLVTLTVSAQKEKLIGNWIETYQIYFDTLDSGIELFNTDVSAYLNGTKKLPDEHVQVKNLFEVFDGDFSYKKRKLEITDENSFLRAKTNDNIDEKITYNKKLKSYVVTFPAYVSLEYLNKDMIVRYNEKTKALQFLKPGGSKETLVCEFVRE